MPATAVPFTVAYLTVTVSPDSTGEESESVNTALTVVLAWPSRTATSLTAIVRGPSSETMRPVPVVSASTAPTGELRTTENVSFGSGRSSPRTRIVTAASCCPAEKTTLPEAP